MPPVVPSAATWGIVLVLALMSGLTTLLGVVLAIRFAKSPGAIALGIGFSAGLMLLIAAAELVPAALREAGAAATATWGGLALGAAMIAVLHVVIPHVHLFEERGAFAIAFVSALAEPAGAVVGLAAVQMQPALNAFFIALAAGAMMFVSVHELRRWPAGSATFRSSAPGSP